MCNLKKKEKVRKLTIKKFKLETKPTTGNVLYPLESEHVKGAKLCANIIFELEGEKRSKTYFEVLEKHYQNQTITELYTGGN